MSDDATPPPAPEPASPDTSGMEAPLDDDFTELLIHQLVAKAAPEKLIRQLLIEIKKHGVAKLLDTISDKNLDSTTFMVIGTSPTQIATVRNWLERIVVPDVLHLWGDIMDKAKAARDDKPAP